MKCIKLFCVLFVITIFPIISENRLTTERGYWDFNVTSISTNDFKGETAFHISVRNDSTDDSYVYGMGSVIIDWEIWHPDRGMIMSGQGSLVDIPQRSHKDLNFKVNIPSHYNIVELRYNITTPNGGHSFERKNSIFLQLKK